MPGMCLLRRIWQNWSMPDFMQKAFPTATAIPIRTPNTGKVILHDHIQHCLVDAIETGDMDAIAELNKAIDTFIK